MSLLSYLLLKQNRYGKSYVQKIWIDFVFRMNWLESNLKLRILI